MAKGFIVSHEAWYRVNGGLSPKDKPYEIIIGDHTEEGWPNSCGVTPQGEFCLVWHNLQSEKHLPAMRIEMFEDSMAWLTVAPDLFRELAALHGKNPQPAKIIEILTRLGYEDVTRRKNPDVAPLRCRCGAPIGDDGKYKEERHEN